ncbi:MAG: hypothetical protein J6S87_10940 [Bacteroidales bacterium]|nr:hypothetical protein [Bacteroidales bacterium]
MLKSKKSEHKNIFQFAKKLAENVIFRQIEFKLLLFIKITSMKKIIMVPQKDTFTICIPEDWVGKPLICILKQPHERKTFPVDSEYVSELREDSIGYQAYHYRMKQKSGRKRLRRKRGGSNRLL